MINPDDFIITRKRKKYRFAKFANSPLCFELDEWKMQPVDVIEVGAGTALFLVELAALYPDKQFAAVDVKADRLQKGALVAEERQLKNIRFIRARADQLTELFLAQSLETIWLTFPDPFPRDRSVRRRLTHSIYLLRYKELLKKNGALYLKHDSRDFFQWSLEQLVREKWSIVELTFDLHESNLNEQYKIMTSYETRWTSEGRVTNFVKSIPSHTKT